MIESARCQFNIVHELTSNNASGLTNDFAEQTDYVEKKIQERIIFCTYVFDASDTNKYELNCKEREIRSTKRICEKNSQGVHQTHTGGGGKKLVVDFSTTT